MDDASQKGTVYAVLAWLAVIVLGIVVFLIWDSIASPSVDTLSTKQSEEIVFVIDSGDEERKFKGDFGEEVRVWDLLQQATALGGIPLEAHSGFVPSRIDGHMNSEKGQWMLYINTELQETPPFNTIAKAGDMVVYKYMWLSKDGQMMESEIIENETMDNSKNMMNN